MKRPTPVSRKVAKRLKQVMRIRFRVATFGLYCMRDVYIDGVRIGSFFEDPRGASAWGPCSGYIGRYPSAQKAVRAMAREAVFGGLL